MKDKKSMIMVIFIGITICLFFCFNTTVFATTGTVTTSELRLRKESSTSSDIITLLDENQEVEILGEDGDWYKVKANNDVGYVNKQFVKVNDNANTNETTEEDNKENEPENTEQQEENTKVQKATVNANSQLRIMPLINGDVIDTAEEKNVFKVVSNLGTWSYVENNQMSGWILTQNLTIEEVEESEISFDNNTESNEPEKQEEVVIEVDPDSMYDEEKTYYVGVNSANVRELATKSSSIINGLTLNNEVTVTGEAGDWYIVSIDGTKGYMAKSLLSTTKKEVTSRSQRTVQNNNYEEEQEESYEEERSTPAPSGSATGESIASYAQQFVGYPYVYGGSGPNSFDCSGFAQYVYSQYGYYINRTADNQAYNGYYVSRDELAPGDLVFFHTYGSGISHVGIYIGGGSFVHASSSRTGVIISSLDQSYYASRYVTARRIAG